MEESIKRLVVFMLVLAALLMTVGCLTETATDAKDATEESEASETTEEAAEVAQEEEP